MNKIYVGELHLVDGM